MKTRLITIKPKHNYSEVVYCIVVDVVVCFMSDPTSVEIEVGLG